MSYELFRNEVITNFSDVMQPEEIIPAINAVDKAAVNYEFYPKSTELTIVNGIPELMKMYIAAKATEGLSQRTLQMYFYHLRGFFVSMAKSVDKITSNDIRVYLFNYKQIRNVSDRTLEQIRIYINGFFDWCVREDLLVKNPCIKVQSIKYYATPREPLNQVELETLRFACKDYREKAIIDLLYSTGMRVSELCNLKIDDINWQTSAIKILHGKGNKFRITYMNAKAVVSLSAYLRTRKDNCPYVIVNDHGIEKHSVSKKTIEYIITEIGKRTDIDPIKLKPHNLRHTFATTMIENGAPVEHVQKLLGHAKINTTMIYARINEADVKRTHERCAI